MFQTRRLRLRDIQSLVPGGCFRSTVDSQIQRQAELLSFLLASGSPQPAALAGKALKASASLADYGPRGPLNPKP